MRAVAASIRVRRFEHEDDSKIHALLARTLPGYAGRERWSWMHKNNPLGFHGPEGDIWVAESGDGRLVGYYGRIRYSMRCFGTTVTASQGLNLATDPQFRKQGIATQLLASSFEDARRNGLSLTFGFPNRLSYRLAIRRGGCDLGEAGELHLVLDSERYLRSRQGGPVHRTLRRAGLALLGTSPRRRPVKRTTGQFHLSQGFAEDAGSVWVSIRDSFDLGLERTREYLEWRYDARWGDYRAISLAKGGQTCGYVVTGTGTKTDSKFTRIYELLASDDEPSTYEALIDTAVEAARKDSSAYLTISASGSEASLLSLKRAGFRRVRWGARYVVNPYEDDLRQRMPRAKAYQSLGDRDYL